MIPAVIVGAYTAWHLGLRLGLVIAGVLALALVASAVIPGLTMTVWGVAIAWCALLYFFGPTIAKNSGKGSGASAARAAGSAYQRASGAWTYLRRRIGGDK